MELINIQNISFATLFVSLLVYVMRENKFREGKYQKTIEKNLEIITEQAKNFDIVKEIKIKVDKIGGFTDNE